MNLKFCLWQTLKWPAAWPLAKRPPGGRQCGLCHPRQAFGQVGPSLMTYGQQGLQPALWPREALGQGGPLAKGPSGGRQCGLWPHQAFGRVGPSLTSGQRELQHALQPRQAFGPGGPSAKAGLLCFNPKNARGSQKSQKWVFLRAEALLHAPRTKACTACAAPFDRLASNSGLSRRTFGPSFVALR